MPPESPPSLRNCTWLWHLAALVQHICTVLLLISCEKGIVWVCLSTLVTSGQVNPLSKTWGCNSSFYHQQEHRSLTNFDNQRLYLFLPHYSFPSLCFFFFSALLTAFYTPLQPMCPPSPSPSSRAFFIFSSFLSLQGSPSPVALLVFSLSFLGAVFSSALLSLELISRQVQKLTNFLTVSPRFIFFPNKSSLPDCTYFTLRVTTSRLFICSPLTPTPE